MPTELLGLIVGGIFGASLILADLANPDRIIGTLRLKDFHAFRVIAVFILVGMAGTWILSLMGLANFNVKLAVLWGNLLGGALLGIGFGMVGYCPGTGLACAAAGRLDALVTVLGMFAGAATFILIYPFIVPQLESVANYGEIRIPQMTGTAPALWVVPIVVIGTIVLMLTRPRGERPSPSAA